MFIMSINVYCLYCFVIYFSCKCGKKSNQMHNSLLGQMGVPFTLNVTVENTTVWEYNTMWSGVQLEGIEGKKTKKTDVVKPCSQRWLQIMSWVTSGLSLHEEAPRAFNQDSQAIRGRKGYPYKGKARHLVSGPQVLSSGARGPGRPRRWIAGVQLRKEWLPSRLQNGEGRSREGAKTVSSYSTSDKTQITVLVTISASGFVFTGHHGIRRSAVPGVSTRRRTGQCVPWEVREWLDGQ